MRPARSHQTALCIIPPDSVWPQIQEIRAVHDQAYKRWMPHINFIYPFVGESAFDQIQQRLEIVLQELKPIEIEFDSSTIDYFKQKGSNCTFHLRPKFKDEIKALQKTIQDLLDDIVVNEKSFEPHLTLGQTTTSRISDIMIEMKSKWRPIKFTIDRICLISRESDPDRPFEIRKQIFLLGRSTEPMDSIVPTAIVPTTIVEPSEPIRMRKKPKATLCIVPPSEFSIRLLHLFEDSSFVAENPFRIILDEYDDQHRVDENLQQKLANIPKFSLAFGARSICFNYAARRLFLKPIDPQALERVHFNSSFDGTLTLGHIDKGDVSEICQRFTDRWTFGTNEFEVDHLHLLDAEGRFQSSFSLMRQCFS